MKKSPKQFSVSCVIHKSLKWVQAKEKGSFLVLVRFVLS